ncbi:MAG: carbon storage regulator CsrA [Fimbriiglobus sp.]|jgi:carbon storage regulator CsrA|nr:carbon storage regulator CsrA [Fimbriiglobus sp.]
MLVLTRKTNEEIIIGDNIRITVVEVAPGRVKIGISAPKSVRVDRAEIHEKKQQEAAIPVADCSAPVVLHNRITPALLPSAADQPAAVPPGAPAEHDLPANRLAAIRRRFPKKPR